MTGESLDNLFKPIGGSTLFELLVIFLIAAVSISLLQRWLPWVANRMAGQRRLILLAIVPFLRLGIILLALITAVPLIIEPSLQNMAVMLGTVGLALGFALKDYASSLIAGIVAISERNYRNGDWVRVGDIYGEVRHVGMRTAEIITPNDDRVLVPHNVLWNEAVINSNNGNARLQCVADFYVAPDHEPEQVRTLLEDVALSSAYVCLFDPVAVVASNERGCTHYRLKAYPVESAQQFRFITDISTRGVAMLRDNGVRFARWRVDED
ncbi:MAG: mechanosensitive ion channel domain-containing protein [Oceanococcaceae bacterium]